jgi:hypothetical protein
MLYLAFFILTHKHKQRLERPATGKHSSLFHLAISEIESFQSIYFYFTNVIRLFLA